MDNLMPLTPDRAMLDYVKKENPGLQVTQGYLRSLVLLGQTGGFTFKIIQDNGVPIPGAQLLERSDSFWATQHAFFIGKVASGATPRSLRLNTFPNPYVFTNAAEREALETLYNGRLKITIANTIYFQQLDLKRFMNVDTAQQGLELSAGATGIFGNDAFNPKTGFYEMTPHIKFSGQSTPQVEVNLSDSVNMAGTAGTTNYAVMYYRGFYISDGANLGK
jgi:hypothetical protein